jgi:hypothetical protein
MCLLMKVGEKPEKTEGESQKKQNNSPQKNTLNNYFRKP